MFRVVYFGIVEKGDRDFKWSLTPVKSRALHVTAALLVVHTCCCGMGACALVVVVHWPLSLYVCSRCQRPCGLRLFLLSVLAVSWGHARFQGFFWV